MGAERSWRGRHLERGPGRLQIPAAGAATALLHALLHCNLNSARTLAVLDAVGAGGALGRAHACVAVLRLAVTGHEAGLPIIARRAVPPPAVTSVSLPSLTPLEHEGACTRQQTQEWVGCWQAAAQQRRPPPRARTGATQTLSLQTLLWQSESTRHFSSSAQGGQLGPPQSKSVSAEGQRASSGSGGAK